MRKIILQEFISLDSLAAGPKDSVDFVPASTEGDKSFAVQLKYKTAPTKKIGKKRGAAK